MAGSEHSIELKRENVLEEKGVMDAVVAGDHLYFVGANVLGVADISTPARPRMVARFPFPGRGRQLVVREGIAYITARADGVFIVDVSRPEAPELLAHYDCTELATGVQVSGNVMVVAQRQYGIEMLDVSNPRQPAFLSIIRTGEAQSVDLRNGYAYVGDWADSLLTTVDIRDPREPKIVARCSLDGYGDGVCVSGDLLYASTGHHNRNAGAYREPGDPGYGAGHGVEIFSLGDPANPEFLTRVEFPQLYARGFPDTWSVVASGHYIYCTDTLNGLFVVDVKEPRRPVVVARYPQLVTGVAVVDDYVYLACVDAGLHVLKARGIAQRPIPEEDTPPAIAPARATSPTDHRVYRPGGQVWGVDFVGDQALVAAGMAGLKRVELWPRIAEVGSVPTQGFAFGVAVHKDLAYVAEGTGGLSIWHRASSGELVPLGRYHEAGMPPVRHVVVYASVQRAILELATGVAVCGNSFLVLDISDPIAPVKVAQHRVHIIYGDQTCHGLVDGRYSCVFTHCNGIRWLDLAASGGEIDTGVDLADEYLDLADGFFAGMVSIGDQVLAVYPGGYRLASALEAGLDQKPIIAYGAEHLGKPRVYGHGLYVSSRVFSQIDIVDIADPQQPRLLRTLHTAGNPGGVVVHGQALLIPDGYNGLLVYDDFVHALGLPTDECTFLPSSDSRETNTSRATTRS